MSLTQSCNLPYANATKYANCWQDHRADLKECKLWNKGIEILRIKNTYYIFFIEERNICEKEMIAMVKIYVSWQQVCLICQWQSVDEPFTIPEADGKIKTMMHLNLKTLLIVNRQIAVCCNSDNFRNFGRVGQDTFDSKGQWYSG